MAPLLNGSGHVNGSRGANDNDIAVIGLSCRFPGDAATTEGFWNMLMNGGSSAGEIPETRWHNSGYHHGTRGRRNTVVARKGHFLSSDIAAFDAEFFHTTPAEAQAMDPQQRMMLEVAYETFENAGLDMESVAGSKTACYVGAFTSDWREMQFGDLDSAPTLALTSSGIELLANRTSWFYDLRGPSVTVETACSASMVSLHLACQSLRCGEATMALVGGANLFLSPQVFALLSNQNFLSPDGICKTFDAQADGYSRGEGVGAILLKPVKDAVRDGDCIRAVIRGTGSNQDGKTPTMTMPSGSAQADLIRATYRSAGLEPTDTHYCEAHGTGTAAGDPAELSGLAQTLCNGRDPAKPLFVGSVKTNIGHLESVAGLAGVIKTILALEVGVLPPSLNCEKPNPKILLDQWNMVIPKKATPWPYAGPRRASVNSFGYGGANAHVIIEDAHHYLLERGIRGHHRTTMTTTMTPSHNNKEMMNGSLTNGFNNGFISKPAPIPPLLFTLSTQDAGGLDRMSSLLDEYLFLDKHSGQDEATLLRDLAYTLGSRRSRFPAKSFYTASSIQGLRDAMSNKEKAVSSQRVSTRSPKLGFVFTGQGAQWARMGVELMSRFHVFRKSVEEADAYLSKQLRCPWSAVAELAKGEADTNIHQPFYSQPLCTVFQVALVELLESWNITPTAVVGHSSGEIAAAYCLGALKKQDAWKAAYYRGFLCWQQQQQQQQYQSSKQQHGSMMAVGASRSRVQAFCSNARSGTCVVACVNSPSSVTISGDSQAVAEVGDMLQKEGIFHRPLKVQAAYHSHHMAPLAGAYLDALGDMETLAGHPGRDMFSSVIGERIDADELGPMNWVKNLISPVLFSDAVAEMKRAGAVDVFVEVGPHAALRGPVGQQLGNEVDYLSTLTRGSDAVECLLELAGHAFIRGVPVNLARVNNTENAGRLLTHLPTYPWKHTRTFWSESRISRTNRLRTAPRASLIGAPYAPMTHHGRLWRGFIRLSEEPWIRDHEIQSSILYPAAGFVAMAIEAARQMLKTQGVVGEGEEDHEEYVLRDVHINSPLVLTETSDAECIIEMRPNDSGGAWQHFSICSSQEDQDLEEHCWGLLTVEHKPVEGSGAAVEKGLHDQARVEKWRHADDTARQMIHHEDFYNQLASIQMVYGPAFRNMQTIHVGTGTSWCTVTVPDDETVKSTHVSAFSRPHIIHPTVLDSMLHAAFAASMGASVNEAAVPTAIRELTVSACAPHSGGAVFQGWASTRPHGYNAFMSDLDFLDASGTKPLVQISGLVLTKMPSSVPVGPTTPSNNKSMCSQLVWTPVLSLAPHLLPELPSVINPLGLGRESHSNSADQMVSAMAEIIKYFALWKPDAEVLLLDLGSSSNGNLPKHLLEALYSPDNTGLSHQGSSIRLTHVSSDEAVVKEVQQCFPVAISVFLQLGTKNGMQALQETSFDAIINMDGLCSALPEDMDSSLVSLRRLLKPEGFLYVAEMTDGQSTSSTSKATLTNGDAKETWTSSLSRNGFHMDFIFAPESYGIKLFGLSTALDPEAEPNGQNNVAEIVVLQPVAPSARVQALTKQIGDILESTSITVKTEAWTRGYTPTVGANYISMLEIDADLVALLSEHDLLSLQKLIEDAFSILWLTGCSDRPEQDLVTGLARAIKNEVASVSFTVLHLSGKAVDDDLAPVAVTKMVLSGTQQEDEYMLSDGVLQTNRVVEEGQINAKVQEMLSHNKTSNDVTLGQCPVSVKLAVETPGLLDTLCFQADESAQLPLGHDEIELDVRATGLNFRDVMVCMGQIPDNLLGFEASGVVRRVGSSVTKFRPGDSVCILGHGAHRSVFRSKAIFCQHMPAGMSFEEAAGLPLVHATAYHALVNVARMRAGQTILIHAAAGGVGQAAVQLAQHLGLEVYATVGSPEKLRLIRDVYGVQEDHIFHSRDTSFAKGVLRATKQRGVDCVLNSLSGEPLRASWNCIAPFGTFVEIGIKDILANSPLEMRPFMQDASFSFLNLEHVQRCRPEVMGDIMEQTFSLLSQGFTRPVHPQNVYPVSRVQEAFRLMQSGKHQGKIAISYGVNDTLPLQLDPGSSIDLSRGGRTYVLVGGLGGLGRSLARLLAGCGAKSLVFLSRSGSLTTPPAVSELARDLRAASVKVSHYTCDISDEASLRSALKTCADENPPIAGVIQCAMVLRDGFFANMSHSAWVDSLAPKVAGTRNLAQLVPRDLDFFILLSSFSGIFGNMGQSNYAAGCTFQDATAHHLRSLGYNKVVSIDLGIMRDVGVLAEQGAKGHHIRDWEEPFGIREDEFHALIKTIILDAAAAPAQIVTGLATGGSASEAGIAEPFYFTTSKFSPMRVAGLLQARGSKAVNNNNKPSLSDELSTADSLAAAAGMIESAVVAKVANIVSTAASNIDTRRPLHDYGVDSLVALEVSNWTLKEIHATVSTFDLLKSTPIRSLCEELTIKSRLVPDTLKS